MDKAIRKKGEPNLVRFQDAVSDLFNRFFEGWDIGQQMGSTWWPLVDVVERENEYMIKADLPGLKSEDIDISIEGNLLTISGQKEQTQEEKDENYYRSERRYGSFRRTVALPASTAPDKIEASYDNGVLTVTVPKAESAKPRKIKVQEHAVTS